MTKEIIIDGIDVSECKNFSCGICEEENKIPRTIEHFTADCTFYPNCYFKQLQRLKKENESLKANKKRCAFKCLDGTFCDDAKIQIDKLKLDKDCLNASLETARKYRGIAEIDSGKYKQALEEIREITEQDRNCMNSELACCRLCDKLDLIKEKTNRVLNDRD